MAASALGLAPNLKQLVLFFVGSVAMRGAGSTYNDLVDREIDAKVDRTRDRPLASGRVSVRDAVVFLIAQCLVGFAVLMTFNGLTIVLALASPLIVLLYPFAKRFTSWPQAILGCAFAYGAVLGWTARSDAVASPALLSGLERDFLDDRLRHYLCNSRHPRRCAGWRAFDRPTFRQPCSSSRRHALRAFRHFCRSSDAHGAFWRIRAGGSSYLCGPPILADLPTRPRLRAGTGATAFCANRDAGLLLFAGFFLQSLCEARYS